MTTNTATWSAESSRPSGLAAILSRLVARLRQDWTRRRTHILLADLDARTLDDIGFNAGNLRRSRPALVDWVVQTHSGTARLVFIGR